MKAQNHTRYIIVSGGVISGVGKGVTTASIGKILTEHGYTTTLIKIDPYINYDAGTLRPTEHGEVWVTEDGGEIDQDLGTYERFIDVDISKCNSITTGQIYKTVIDRERRGEYLGQTVQFIPHITDEVIARIKQASAGYDIAIIEIGGIVGDYENIPFLCAIKSLERELGNAYVVYILVTYLPVPAHIGEMKTKPTQQAIKMLGEQGILPDFIICRAHIPLDEVRKKKIEIAANIAPDHVIAAPDVESVYQIPLIFEEQQLGKKILNHFGLHSHKQPNWSTWKMRVENIINPKQRVKIAVIGKYLASGNYNLADSYVSIEHALTHAGAQLDVGVAIEWIDSTNFEQNDQLCAELDLYDGVIVPGGFGNSGVEGKIRAIHYVRTHSIPYLGICYGLQLAAVEFARSVCGLHDANTTEVNEKTPYPIVTILPLQKKLLDEKRFGGSMRLGMYKAYIKPDTRIHTLYNQQNRIIIEQHSHAVVERHRHRYEVNPAYVEQLSAEGLVFSGYYVREDGAQLMEFLEIPEHPFFIATQAHPEFKSRLSNPSPLFFGLVQAAMYHKEYKTQYLNNQCTLI